jgi:predicted NAD/FAD-dependent oxidoreductase
MRLFNRLLVFALGIVFIALGFIAAVEAIWTGLGYQFLWFPGREWLRTLRTTPWSARSVLVGAAIVALIALMLLIAEIRPWRKRLVRTLSDQDDTWLLHRRSTEHHVARNLVVTVPRTPIRTHLDISSHRWKLSLRADAAASTRPKLKAAGRDELEKLGAPAGSTVQVRTTRGPGAQ